MKNPFSNQPKSLRVLAIVLSLIALTLVILALYGFFTFKEYPLVSIFPLKPPEKYFVFGKDKKGKEIKISKDFSEKEEIPEKFPRDFPLNYDSSKLKIKDLKEVQGLTGPKHVYVGLALIQKTDTEFLNEWKDYFERNNWEPGFPGSLAIEKESKITFPFIEAHRDKEYLRLHLESWSHSEGEKQVPILYEVYE